MKNVNQLTGRKGQGGRKIEVRYFIQCEVWQTHIVMETTTSLKWQKGIALR